jgi:vacuolar protein sorting-associated protein 11
MAIGFERGNISLYRGDIARDKSKTLKTLTAGTSAITGIEFKYTDKVNTAFLIKYIIQLIYLLS